MWVRRACFPFFVCLLAMGLSMPAIADHVYVDPHLPILNRTGKSTLSPPRISAVDQCSQHVFVGSFVPHATVIVVLNGTTVVGTAIPHYGFSAVALTQPLHASDNLTATQTVNGVTSAPSNPAVVVGHMPPMLPAPTIDAHIYACGRIVPAHNLLPGVTVSVKDVTFSSVIGDGVTPNDWGSDWAPVFTSALVAAHGIAATQSACGAERSLAPVPVVPVLPEPSPLKPPSLQQPIVGNDSVTMGGLYTGALIEVLDHAKLIGSGFATGVRNWQGVSPGVSAASLIRVRQSLCHHGPWTSPQQPTDRLAAPLLAAPICPNQSSVTVRRTTLNATVVLFANGSIVGYAGATPGDLTMTVAPPNAFQNGDHVSVLQYVHTVVSPHSNTVRVNCSGQNVVTQHNDNARQGAQLRELALTPASVAGPHFGLLYDRAVLGTILAQPLYVHGVRTASGVKNLVFIATSQDMVYAFDADDLSADTVIGGESTKKLWRRSLGTPHTGDICEETDPPVVGITSTPVIDVSAGIMYVVARDQHGGVGFGNDYLHAIDIENGADLRSKQVGGSATVGGSAVTFDPSCQRQRPGLLLLNGVVYLGYGTYDCDKYCPANTPYRGWIIGYRASDFSSAGIFTNSQAANEGGMGVWASGNGLAATDDGSVFYETGNDIGGSRLTAYGDSFMKLKSDGTSLAVSSHYQPVDANMLRIGDTDLGSGGPMLLPAGKLVGGGKDGSFFVLSQSNLAAAPVNFQAFYNTFHVGPTPYPYNAPPVWPSPCTPAPAVGGVANPDQPCYIDPSFYPKGEAYGPNIHGGTIFWQTDASHGYIYKMSEKDYLKAFSYDLVTGTVNPAATLVASVRPAHDGMPGGFSSLSANKALNGIVWTVVQQLDGQWGPASPALLYAFDATNLHTLWNNGTAGNQVAFAKFNSPTIADAKVFLPSVGLFQVYGLSPTFPHKIIDLPYYQAIVRRWLNTGGLAGTLGRPTTQFLRDEFGGVRQDFTNLIVAGGYGNISVPPWVKIARPMCRNPETQGRVRVESSIYFTRKTGPHFVRGEIRRLFLELGGPKRFGFPLSDEVSTPDGSGLMTRFEHATISWYPGNFAYVGGPRKLPGQALQESR